MQRYFKVVLVAILVIFAPCCLAGDIKWSVIVYAAVNEEEIAQFTDPIIQKMINTDLPPGIELILQHATFANKAVTRAVRRPKGLDEDLTLEIPKHDTASHVVFSDFLNWAHQNAKGEKKLFVTLTHSWGWQGIFQDSPSNNNDKDTIMPIRYFAEAFEKSPLKFDVLFLDSCVLASAEVLEDMKNTAPYIVASQRETPYASFPYHLLFKLFTNMPEISPEELAKILPIEYAKAYTNEGSMGKEEKEFDIVTAVTVDTRKWNYFSDEFAKFTSLLSSKGLRRKIEQSPTCMKIIADKDDNVDMVEFLMRVPGLMNGDAEIKASADKLINIIGYPKELDEFSKEKLKIESQKVASIKIYIEADKFIPESKILENLKTKWKYNNQDLNLPNEIQLKIEKVDEINYLTATLDKVTRDFEIRPWLPGVRYVGYSYTDHDEKSDIKHLTRKKDYVSHTNFPESSFLLSEAHTNGAPFIHGIGLVFQTEMTEDEIGKDPDTGQKGPGYYKNIKWNKKTKWGNLILLDRNKK